MVYTWAAIKEDFSHGLILGNGASIAFDDRFAYHSLKDKAQEFELISDDVQRVFEHLETADFELVLRMLWHASKINEALRIEDERTTTAYRSVRDALIEVVRAIHPSHEEVHDRLSRAAAFMSRFKTVVSLSYDVLVYWAILAGNKESPNRFKDCFLSGEFEQDWHRLRESYGSNCGATLVVYPHGNLALGADLGGGESKIPTDAGMDLLSTVFACWCSGARTPVFVSEGTSEQKKAAIRRSPYLSTIYDEILPDVGDTVVVLGWTMNDNDDHLLDAACRRAPRRFAFGVDPDAANLGEFQAMVRRKLAERLRGNTFKLIFFDRSSEGCWIAP